LPLRLSAVSRWRALSFASFELFPGQRLLSDGNDQIQLDSRALDMLIVLAERVCWVVPKEES
jgi:DNA-binding winged helix-turn-helix (wHTH) protein